MSIKLFHKLKRKAVGESLLETLLAITFVTLIMSSVYVLLTRAISTNANIHNRVLALNVAREGIEGVRNVRDTNWLNYSGDLRNNWLCYKTPCVASTDKIQEGYYTIDYDNASQRYVLSGPVSTSVPASQINLQSPIGGETEQYRLFDNGTRLTHKTDPGNTATEFYRQIELAPQNPYNELTPKPLFCDDEAGCKEGRLKIVSRVQWREADGVFRNVVLETYLFDFFARNSYDG